MTDVRPPRTAPDAARAPRASTRLVLAGGAMMAAGGLALLAVFPETAADVLPPLVVVALTCALVWRFGRWAHAIAGVVGVLVLATVLPAFADPAGADVRSFWNFTPAVTIALGAGLFLAGGVANLRRREDFDVQRGLLGVGAVAVLAAVVSGAFTVLGSSTLSPEERAGATEVVMVDTEFATTALSVERGTTARFVVRNEGLSVHTFTVDELGIDTVVRPGAEVLVTAEVPATAQTLQFYCTPHAAGEAGERVGMVGALTVG